MPKVLIIEQSNTLADRISQFLKKKGIETAIAPDGNSGFSFFATGAYDLLLIDIQLPPVNGEDLCKRIRATGKSVPLIMMSMTAQDPADIEGLKKELALTGFLTKPFTAEALYAMIASALQLSAGKSASAAPPQGAGKEPPAIQGDLVKSPFEKVLLYVMVKKTTGVLTLTREATQRRFFFLSGAAAELEVSAENDSFGAYLLQKKRIDTVELREYEERRNKQEEDPRDLFVKMGCLTPHQFLEENRDFLHDRLTDCFSWSTGSFLIEWKPSFIKTMPVAGIFMPSLFFKGFRAHLTPARISSFMQEKGNLYPDKTAAFFEYQNQLAPEASGAELLERIDGLKTCIEIMDSIDPDDAAALFFTLDHLKLLSYAATPKKSEIAPPFTVRERAAKPQVKEAEKFEDLGGELKDLDAELGPFGEMKGVQATAAETESLGPLEENLKKQWEEMKDKNYYELFGMTQNTYSFDKLKKAYFHFTRTYGPDKFFASPSEIMSLAEEFLSRISNAYETLTNVVSKENYDELIASHEKVPTGEEEKKFYEQIQFQSGKVFIEQGQFDSAEKAFTNCMTIDPQKSDYYAYLALALYNNPANKGNPAAIKRAKDMVNKSLQLGRLSIAYALKGTMLLDEGSLNFAEAEFFKALKLNPNNKTAQKNLEIIKEKREKEKKGLFGRMFK